MKHQQQLRAFVVALAPDFSAADEVMQETFLEVSRKASEFQLGSNFPAWARTIARFKVLGLTRDRQRAASRLADDVVEALAAAAPPEEDEGRYLAVIDLLRKCLERLAPAARELVRLRYEGEHLPEEMARIRSQSVNAINVTLSRARLALRQCVENGLKSSEATP